MKFERLLLATVLATSTGFAFAHGSKPHDKPAAASVEDAEQMAWGIHGAGVTPGRTIEIRMSDKMRFSPEAIEVNEGDVVRFVVHNDGKLMHEFVLGTQKSNDEHAKLMMRFPNMEHDEPHMAHVQAGGQGEILWRFNRAGDFHFACLIAGHYQAGMVGKIKVKPQ